MTRRFMKGNAFIVHKKEGLWHWTLWKHQSGPIAQSIQGYTTRQSAIRSIRSARNALHEATIIEGREP
ncbi:MAG: DUF1508 domain-containing protein [Rhodospirillaceae bacterium]|nr:DUF1508 domain-containing protein [Rhodospirillaceae bacterium]